MANAVAAGPIATTKTLPACAARRCRAQASRSSIRFAIAPGIAAGSIGVGIRAGGLERTSVYIPEVEGDDTGREIVHDDAIEARGVHHCLERLLVGMHPDRFGEIPVARIVARDELPDPWNHLEAVPVVGGRQRLPDTGEFEHRGDTAGFQYAAH